ncbi:MAG: zinc ribbon domain-containing protein [Methanoregula sp.]|jgi:hypothetical protein|nr:zinc ribbon domain-containing protein [Methanoregula sp.]
MAYPNLYNDESIILETKNVKVKSVTFEAILTSRRLILTDSKKQTMPPQEILLATLKNVDSGENAIRDPTITLSIITNTGTTRQMILTFSSKTSSGERKRECDEWVKILRQHVSQTIEHPVFPDIPTLDDEIPQPATEPVQPAIQPPRIEIVNAPLQKKRIEISRPMKKIIESEPAMPAPIETTSLPVGSFCNRCGSRVPPESAFCNRCGTPVAKDSDLDAVLVQPVSPRPVPVPEPVPAPVVPLAAIPEVPPVPAPVVPLATITEVPPVPAPVSPLATITEVPPVPAPVAPQVAVPLPPIYGQPADVNERPIERVIQSIEPLIEDSIPRRHEALPVKKTQHAQAPSVTVAAEPESPAAEPAVQWPVLPSTAPTVESPPGILEIPPPPPIPTPSGGKGKIIAIAVAGLIIIAVIAGIFLFANPLQMINGQTPELTPIPTVVPLATTAPATTTVTVSTTTAHEITMQTTTAPALAIPATGVWVRINYANQFSGTVGTPNALKEISGTGEQFFQISTSTGTVVANIQKVDGSADPMSVEVYKDGKQVMQKSTTAPKGMVEIQVSLKPAATPTPEPTILITTIPTEDTAAAESNSTANATVSE